MKSEDYPNKDTQSLHGKTIKNIRQIAINCWAVNFTDNTHTYLWAENDGPLTLGQLWLSQSL